MSKPSWEQRKRKALEIGKAVRGQVPFEWVDRAPQPPVGVASCPRCKGRGLVATADGRHVPCPRCKGKTATNEGSGDGQPAPTIQGSGTADGRHRSAEEYLTVRNRRELVAMRERVEEDRDFRDAYMRMLVLAAGDPPGSGHRNNGR
jgi:hypothetical protein